MTALQPKMNEVREKHKHDQQAQAKAMMELYKEHKVSPFSSCLPLLIQLPILIGLYQVFRVALNSSIDITVRLQGLYSFIHHPSSISPLFLGLLDLSKPAWILGVVAGLAQFWQSKLMMPKTSGQGDSMTKMMSMQTTYILPVVSVLIALKLPAGLPLYWIVTTLFGVAQQYYINRSKVEPAV